MAALIVSHEHRFIFLKTRKTAGTSIEIALSRVCGPDDIISPIADVDEEIRVAAGGRGPQHHLSPPLPRPVGAHMPAVNVKRLVGPKVWSSYTKLSAERNPWDAVVSLYFWHYKDDAERPPFSEFLAGPRIHSLSAANARGYRIRGELAVDTLLRHESLAQDLADVWARLDLPGTPELPHAKAGTRPARAARYRDMYTPEQVDLVAAAFADVIALLGYEF